MMAANSFLPGTGRGTAARSAVVEGLCNLAYRLPHCPSTAPLRVAAPLPASGEER